MANVAEKLYVIEVSGQTAAMEHLCDNKPNSQIKKARYLAKLLGRGAVLSGEACFFWADVMSDGTLQVGAFDEDLFEED